MTPELEAGLRLIYAAVLGGIIGFQRERYNKPAGLRTHILICMGSALFTVASIYGFAGNVDPARVAAGVVTGIGFIGAGVIFRGMKGDKVVGITTAASVWVTAAIGITAGVGMYIISAVVTLITFFVLVLPRVKG